MTRALVVVLVGAGLGLSLRPLLTPPVPVIGSTTTTQPVRAAAHLAEPPDQAPAGPDHFATQPPAPADFGQQDQVSRAHDRREARAFDGRPLLAHLPMVIEDAVIDVAGLATDGQTTIIEVKPLDGRVATARAAYRQALRARGDSGAAYLPRFVSLRSDEGEHPDESP